eukprot:Skav214245  [mRNA]  locus=scaffold2045:153948:155717:- [translate_table: standard]
MIAAQITTQICYSRTQQIPIPLPFPKGATPQSAVLNIAIIRFRVATDQLMAEADKYLFEVCSEAAKNLTGEVAPGQRNGLKEFLEVLLEKKSSYPNQGGPLDHPLNHMFTEKHFEWLKLDVSNRDRDIKEVEHIFHSFWRCFSDKSNPPQIDGGKQIFYGKFSHGGGKGKVFKFTVNTGESKLRKGFAITDKELLSKFKGVKEYCHRASAAVAAGAIGGAFGAGLGAYVFEKLFRRVALDLDYEISEADEVALQFGKLASLPAGALVGASVAKFVAGFQCISTLSTMKFQVCAIIAGAGAGFLAGIAVTGAATAIGLCVTWMVEGTEKCKKLAEVAKGRRVQLQKYVAQMTSTLTSRFKKIQADLDAVGLLIDEAQTALKKGISSEQEVLQWIGVGCIAKLGLQQILEALSKLEEDVLEPLRTLEAAHSNTSRQLRDVVDRQARAESNMDRFEEICEGICCQSMNRREIDALISVPLAQGVRAISVAVHSHRSKYRKEEICEHEQSLRIGENGMQELHKLSQSSRELGDKCKVLLEEVEILLNQQALELDAKLSGSSSCFSPCMCFFSRPQSGMSPEDSWLVKSIIAVY